MKNLVKLFGLIALVAVIVFSVAGCGGDGGGGDPELSGTISIIPNTDVYTGATLTATYIGSEPGISYQWKRDTTNLGTEQTQVADQAGNYTVTISAAGYKSKTSYAVRVTVPTGLVWNPLTDSTFDPSNISAIAYGNNIFVAGTSGGKIATSSDGTTWTWQGVINELYSNDRPLFSGYDPLRAIAYGNGKFIAVGGEDEVEMAISTNNGTTWQDVRTTWQDINNKPFGYYKNFNTIVYGNNTFVAVGSNGKIATSPDGTNWTAVTNSTFGSYDIKAIAFGNGKFVAVGDDSSSSDSSIIKIATSPDGITWTAVSNATFDLYDSINSIAYGNNTFVVAGYYSGYLNYSMVYSCKTAYSTDGGVTWTAIKDSTFGSSRINVIFYGNNKFVAMGQDGKMAYLSDR